MSDSEAIRQLYAGSYRRLVVQLYPVTGDLSEAQDVVQEAFVRLLAAPRRLPGLENPEAWLRTVAVNLARSRWRRRKVLRRLLRRLETEPAAVPGATPDHVALMAALRRLPAGQRAAIALHYLADLPVTEVAATLQVGDDCEGLLSVTEDGGETWSELRKLPSVSGVESWDAGPGSCLLPLVIQVAERTLVMPVPRETVPGHEWVDPPSASFISRDAGRTWQEYAPRLRTAEAVPEGVWPERHCEDDLCTRVRMGWYDPATGDRVVLDNDPPAAGGNPTEPMVAGDGSIWLAGTGADGEYLVSVSRDRGRSWQTEAVTTPEPGNPTSRHGVGVAPTDGSTAYAAIGESAGGRTEVVLYRSTDHGASWQRLAQPLPFDRVASMWGAPDGTLVLVDEAGAHHTSSDGGETFAQVDLPVWDTAPIAGGFFAGALDDSPTDPVVGYLSEDGVTWWPVRIPRP